MNMRKSPSKKASVRTKTQLQELPPETKCRVSYRNDANKYETVLKHVNWRNVVAMTILFDKPKTYNNDGDCCLRDGYRVLVVD
ncbi:MAG: hypothetical protein WCG45_04300 [bacterium]